MAILIPLRRVYEDNLQVVYDFFASDAARGRLVLDKANGDVILMEGESDRHVGEFTTSRASRALRLRWEQGEYPAETDYRA